MATSDTDLARRVLLDEARALHSAADALTDSFQRAVDIVVKCNADHGTVLVSGLGKSGLIGAKIAATMSSLGVVAHAVHPTEAAHGDLGRFRPQDAAICLSHSGETEELCALAAALRQDRLPIIAITKSEGNSLGRLADAVLEDGVDREAATAPTDDDPETLPPAPTSSTTSALALGDALCLAVARRLRFTDADFARRHPGGQLGGLLRPVTDLLRFRAGENLPIVAPGLTVSEALRIASQVVRRPGALLIADPRGPLAGIFTDSDLRRLLLDDIAALEKPIGDVMTASPRALLDTALARDAVAMVREHRQDEIPVVDAAGLPVGLLDVQDLVAMRLVSA
ncbi:MAG: KpsF/GutQ family sugar-phosphate isomerase [Planctomycetota bacterium]